MRKVFVNLTAHNLTEEQVEEAKRRFGVSEFLSAEDILDKEVVAKLRQSPGNIEELRALALDVAEVLEQYARKNNVELYVHLPAGSPAFMWVLSLVWPYGWAIPVFSHSRREVIEEKKDDGSVVKRSVFRFEGYIVDV